MTTTITTTCDKCGADLSDGRGYEFQLSYKDLDARAYIAPSTFLVAANFHLCNECSFSEKIFLKNVEDAPSHAERVVRLLSELLDSMGVSSQD